MSPTFLILYVTLVGQMSLSAHIGESTDIAPVATSSGSGGPLSTHVLDTSRGVPGAGVPITLYIMDATHEWRLVSSGVTNNDGRLSGLIEDAEIPAGVYKLVFDTETYFNSINVTGFWPFVDVVFKVKDTKSHYHVPLVINPYGYSTYRGS